MDTSNGYLQSADHGEIAFKLQNFRSTQFTYFSLFTYTIGTISSANFFTLLSTGFMGSLVLKELVFQVLTEINNLLSSGHEAINCESGPQYHSRS